MMQASQKGLTLVETVITVTVVMILLTLSTASIRTIYANNRIYSTAEQLQMALKLTKTEALRRASSASICAATDANQNECSDTPTWQNGWIIFADSAENGSISDSDDRIKVSGLMKENLSVSTTQKVFTFNDNGFLVSSSGDINISAPHCSGSHGKQLSINSVGRITSSSTTDCS